MPWDFAPDRPIYLQLIEHIQQKIISGEYQPGDRLPSVRELAAQAAVNPNTMQKALAELERGGLVYSQRTSGRFITDDALLLQNLRRRTAVRHVNDFLQNMQTLGFSPEDAAGLLAEHIRAARPQLPGPDTPNEGVMQID